MVNPFLVTSKIFNHSSYNPVGFHIITPYGEPPYPIRVDSFCLCNSVGVALRLYFRREDSHKQSLFHTSYICKGLFFTLISQHNQ